MDVTLALCRAVHDASAIFLFGASAFAMALPQDACPAEGTLRPLYAIAAVTALVTSVLWFFLTAASMAGVSVAALGMKTLHLVLFYTDFGALWIWRLAAAFALAVWIFVAPRRGRGFAFLAAIFLASLAFTGHAAVDTGWAGFAHRAADIVHLLSIGLWLGGLVMLMIVLRGAAHDAALAALRRFAVVAAPAVALVLMTGTVNALFVVSRWSEFFVSRYGLLLLGKLALAAAMIALALLNRLILLPRMTGGDVAAAQEMRASVMGEIVLGAAVLAIVGVLGITQP